MEKRLLHTPYYRYDSGGFRPCSCDRIQLNIRLEISIRRVTLLNLRFELPYLKSGKFLHCSSTVM